MSLLQEVKKQAVFRKR